MNKRKTIFPIKLGELFSQYKRARAWRNHDILRGLTQREEGDNSLPYPFSLRHYARFNKCDTYNLDKTLICWLLEHLSYLRQEGGKVVYFNFNVTIDNETYPLASWIIKMEELCRVIATKESCQEEVSRLFTILAATFYYLWW